MVAPKNISKKSSFSGSGDPKNRFESLFQNARDAIVISDSNGFVTAWNRSAEDMFGYSAAEAVGQKLSIIIPPRYRDAHDAGMKRYRETGVPKLIGTTIEVPGMKKDGTHFPIELSLSSWAEGETRFITGIMRDISERKKVQAELQKAKDELEERVQERTSRLNNQYKIARILSETGTSEEIYSRLLEHICSYYAWPVGAIWQISEDGTHLSCLHMWCVNSGFENFRESSLKKSFKKGEGLPGSAWKESEPVWITDVTQNQNFHFLRMNEALRDGVVSAAAFPIILNGSVTGVIEFFSSSPHAENEDMALMIRSMAGQIGQYLERRRAEAAREKSERRLKAIFDQVIVGIVQIGLDGRFVLANSKFCEILGRPLDEIMALGIWELTHPEEAPTDTERIEKLLKGGSESGFVAEKRFVRPDGSVIWAILSLSLVRDASGNPSGAVAAVQNISDQKKAQQALADSEERYRWLVENTSEAIWRFDLEKPVPINLPVDEQIRLVYKHAYLAECNERMAQLYGFKTCGEVQGMRLNEFMVEADSANTEYLSAFIASGYRLLDAESTEKDKKGGMKYFLNNLIGYVEDGCVLRAWGTSRDITERKQIELALRRSEAHFRELADAMPQIVWTARPDGYLDYYNKRWYEYTGGTQDAGGDQNWTRFLHPEDVQPCLDKWYASVKTGEVYEIEYRFKDRKTDRYVWHLGRAFPIRDETGEIVRWFGTSTDIDMQKQAERKLREAAEELLRSNTELEQFAYVASHDLQEPLRMVATYTELLAAEYKNKLGEEAHTYINFAVSGAQRAQELIHDLLNYSQVRKSQREDAQVDMNEVLQDVLKTLSVAIDKSGAAVTSDPLPRVMGDRVRLFQLLQNLIGNALKFKKEEGAKVHIGARERGKQWVFSIADNGIGIDPAFREKIFVIFQRLHTRSKYPGTGIGLAICKKIVEQHSGEIWFESEPGKGSTFYFTLPAA